MKTTYYLFVSPFHLAHQKKSLDETPELRYAYIIRSFMRIPGVIFSSMRPRTKFVVVGEKSKEILLLIPSSSWLLIARY